MVASVLAGAVLLAPAAKLKVVTTTSDLASITREVGGSRVSVSAIVEGSRDPHRIEAKPSYMSRTRDAHLFISVGLDLEIGYESAILQGSGNRRVQPGQPGHLYASRFAYVLEKPQGGVTRAHGDIHPYGNPHIWLDPWNGRLIAAGIAQKLTALDPSGDKEYDANLNKFLNRLDAAMFGAKLVEKIGAHKLWQWQNDGALRKHLSEAKAWEDLGGWAEQMAPVAGRAIVTYHRSFTYFAHRFGLKVVDELEPKPGLDPTPGHLASVIRRIQNDNVKAILQETFFSPRHAKFVAERTGAKVVVVPQNVGHDRAATDYITLFDTIVSRVSAALK
jgi:zinc/manganese transport system substrate-binding protein